VQAASALFGCVLPGGAGSDLQLHHFIDYKFIASRAVGSWDCTMWTNVQNDETKYNSKVGPSCNEAVF
jgi:hypothetical protein